MLLFDLNTYYLYKTYYAYGLTNSLKTISVSPAFRVMNIKHYPTLPCSKKHYCMVLYHAMVSVTLYYKEGCWLCDTAEEMLNGLKVKYDIHTKKVDIESDDELYELYRYEIPVFEFRDGSNLYGRIRKNELVEKLEQNKE